MTNDEALYDFVEYLSSEKGLSRHTIDAYQRDVRNFLKQNVWNEASKESFYGYISWLKGEGYKSSSISRMIISLKVFYKFLKREKLIETNETVWIDSPKIWQLIPQVLSLNEYKRLLTIMDKTTFLGARDQAIIELLYSSGLRVSELCGLTLYDIHDDFVRVKGKGGKERMVPVGSYALEAVDHFLHAFRFQFESDENKTLFLTPKGKPISRLEVWSRIRRYAKLAGITKKVTPHTFRHTFATHLLDNGADLRVIQDMLGHANINSTDRYTHISRSKLQESFAKFHTRYRM